MGKLGFNFVLLFEKNIEKNFVCLAIADAMPAQRIYLLKFPPSLFKKYNVDFFKINYI